MRCLLLKKAYRSLLIAICISLVLGVLIGLHLSQIPLTGMTRQNTPYLKQSVEIDRLSKSNDDNLPAKSSNTEKDTKPFAKSDNTEKDAKSSASNLYENIHVDLKHVPSKNKVWPKINYNVHTFYYMWYGNPQLNGHYIHWNHVRIAHWDARIAKQHSQQKHNPPEDIGANFYPQLGLYSSADSAIVYKHMEMIRSTGIGVVVVSWYHKDRNDPNGSPVDHLIPMLLDTAHMFTIKVALHLEPYSGRTVRTIHDDLNYVFSSNYTSHPAYYRRPRRQGGRALPVFYIYDSYLIEIGKWRQLTHPDKHLNIRGTKLDAFLVGLYLNANSCTDLAEGGFDAAYTYFASTSVSHGSENRHWAKINAECESKKVYFAPSFGPGYVDTAVRPWNGASMQNRLRGAHYRRMFWSLMRLNPRPVMWSVTSFNEWHEGSQIEPAVPKQNYLDYLPKRPDFYLEMTRRFVEIYSNLPPDVTIPPDSDDILKSNQ